MTPDINSTTRVPLMAMGKYLAFLTLAVTGFIGVFLAYAYTTAPNVTPSLPETAILDKRVYHDVLALMNRWYIISTTATLSSYLFSFIAFGIPLLLAYATATTVNEQAQHNALAFLAAISVAINSQPVLNANVSDLNNAQRVLRKALSEYKRAGEGAPSKEIRIESLRALQKALEQAQDLAEPGTIQQQSTET